MANPFDEFDWDKASKSFGGVMTTAMVGMHLAKFTKTYHEELVRLGFSDEEAMRVTLSVHEALAKSIAIMLPAFVEAAAKVAEIFKRMEDE